VLPLPATNGSGNMTSVTLGTGAMFMAAR